MMQLCQRMHVWRWTAWSVGGAALGACRLCLGLSLSQAMRLRCRGCVTPPLPPQLLCASLQGEQPRGVVMGQLSPGLPRYPPASALCAACWLGAPCLGLQHSAAPTFHTQLPSALALFDPPRRVQLVSLCRFVGIQPFGTDAFLRGRLRRHLQEIKASCTC